MSVGNKKNSSKMSEHKFTKIKLLKYKEPPKSPEFYNASLSENIYLVSMPSLDQRVVVVLPNKK